MTVFGILIGNHITNSINDANIKYQTAIKIDNSPDQFKYGMDTDIGYAFVYGNLDAVDTVSIDKYTGISVSRELEEYRMHTRLVTYTDSKGKSHTRIETYYTWDHIETISKLAKNVNFCGSIFPTDKFPLPGESYMDTVSAGYRKRYNYFLNKTHYTGTLFSKLENHTISEANFHQYTIDKTEEYLLKSKAGFIVFWIVWIILTIVLVVVFCLKQNYWLNDN